MTQYFFVTHLRLDRFYNNWITFCTDMILFDTFFKFQFLNILLKLDLQLHRTNMTLHNFLLSPFWILYAGPWWVNSNLPSGKIKECIQTLETCIEYPNCWGKSSFSVMTLCGFVFPEFKAIFTHVTVDTFCLDGFPRNFKQFSDLYKNTPF